MPSPVRGARARGHLAGAVRAWPHVPSCALLEGAPQGVVVVPLSATLPGRCQGRSHAGCHCGGMAGRRAGGWLAEVAAGSGLQGDCRAGLGLVLLAVPVVLVEATWPDCQAAEGCPRPHASRRPQEPL